MSLRSKWIVVFAVLFVCMAVMVSFPELRLGLDLKGGTQIVVQVQMHEAFKAEADRTIERLKRGMEMDGIPYSSIKRNDPNTAETAETIKITVGQPGDLTCFATVAGNQWSLSESGIKECHLMMRPEAASVLRREIIGQTVRTIERRLDLLGISEVTVQQRGSDREAQILIQVPGLNDMARVQAILKTTAVLEFCEVIGGPFPNEEAARTDGKHTQETKLVSGESGVWILSRYPLITGVDLRDARAQRDELSGRWDTVFSLSPDASRRFQQYTAAHIHEYLAIVLDNQVLSVPRIDSAILDEGRITGSRDAQTASDLAVSLRAGALPAGVEVTEGSTVGPSLGADSIRQGVTSGIIGLSFVIASMVLYYHGAGVNAVVALMLNTLITVAVLNAMGAAWTLPGVAGLVLSIGMAVDSNVLIFERIKEEIRNGRGPARAVSAGFDRAFVTIIDTHVTTVVAAAFLFMFGTRPVRGFATTLFIGLAANLFTAVFVSRLLFESQLKRQPTITKLSFGRAWLDAYIGRLDLDMMRRRKLTIALSVLMCAAALGVIAVYGLKPGLDFRGGTQVQVQLEQQHEIDTVRRALAATLEGEFIVQKTDELREFIIETQVANEKEVDSARRSVEDALATIGKAEIRSTTYLGPRAGAEMRQRALLASAGALAGMLIYIAFRFRLISGVAAVAATIHDVVITLALFAWSEREINLNIVAAVLTLIGYSMNDKIVVFDRVRENLRQGVRAASFPELVNRSINQTLSRTILTAGPTLLACIALYVWGGAVLNGIAFALFAGIVVATYSSVFVASALLVIGRRS